LIPNASLFLLEAVGNLLWFFPRQVVGFDEANAFGKIRNRFGEGLGLFLAVAGFPQRVFPWPVTKGQDGNFCLRGNERSD
jgi:hypothetical protein